MLILVASTHWQSRCSSNDIVTVNAGFMEDLPSRSSMGNDQGTSMSTYLTSVTLGLQANLSPPPFESGSSQLPQHRVTLTAVHHIRSLLSFCDLSALLSAVSLQYLCEVHQAVKPLPCCTTVMFRRPHWHEEEDLPTLSMRSNVAAKRLL